MEDVRCRMKGRVSEYQNISPPTLKLQWIKVSERYGLLRNGLTILTNETR